ncbi:MAG TPA: hypothetical protein ENK88_05265, partial [Campylobacterales bacterium]|nr:hypothetical protein [Campylobacterales bacterium]
MNRLIILLLLSSSAIYAENNQTSDYNKMLAQKLFEKAFKNKASSKKIYFPLKVNNILQDEVFVKIDENDNLFIKKETMEYVASLLKDKYRKNFQYKIKKDGFAPLSALNQFGIVSKYDRDNITINV